MDLANYMKRIKFPFDGNIKLDFENLGKLQACHQLHVPWENLDTLTGKTFDLKYESLYDKIVAKGRGGWCHELNGIFCWGLRKLGFDVMMINSRCWNSGRLCREFDHMVPLVTLDNGDQYLVDVGYGSSTSQFAPLKLDDGAIQPQPGNRFKTTRESDGRWVVWFQSLDAGEGDDWERMYVFEKRDHDIADFEATCQCYQRAEDDVSFFMTVNPIVMLKTHDGRGVKLLVQTKYREYVGLGSKATRKTTKREDDLGREDMQRILRDEFDMDVDLSGMNMEEVRKHAAASTTDARKLE